MQYISNLVEPETEVSVPVFPRSRDSLARQLAKWWARSGEFVLLVVQLALLAIVIKRYSLESPAFYQLTLLAFGGFAVHYFLPLRYRLLFFLMLSLTGLVLVLGGSQAAWLVGIGLALIGICHLPLPLVGRVVLLVAVGGVLAAMRANWFAAPWPMAIWPILGSMFMFRLMIYLYDLEHQTAPVSPVRSLSYFFLLPNVCFPLFPVVDYQAFCRRYYDDDRHQIYQVGVRWIFRGVLHLILYRILYKNWSISLYDVHNAGDFVHYSLWLFLLYLRISGQFHIVVGILHLYGFNLAETHNLYYLSASFTDFWRRINIYWKDFMMKLFFYPTYFRLKRWGPVAALVVSTLMVFFITWLLHAIQWFWLRGSFLLVPHDVLFWAILAAIVVVNSIVELKLGRRRAMGGTSWRHAAIVGLKTLATFTVICILWSLWCSESLSAWLTLWQFALIPPTSVGWLVIATVVACIFGGAMFIARHPQGHPWAQLSFFQEAALRSVILILLAAISIHAINQRMGIPGQLIASAKTGDLNRIEMAELERGYYEDLLDVDRFNGELWNLYLKRPRGWTDMMGDHMLSRKSPTLRHELQPSVEGPFKNIILRTNRWGMHDKEYAKEPHPSCDRIALLGSSNAMGSGVMREETFEALLEDRLNHELVSDETNHYEILNFAVSGYYPPNQIEVLEEKAVQFRPRSVFYVGHAGDEKRASYDVVRCVIDGVQPREKFIRDLLEREGIDRRMPEPIIRRRLAPFGEEILFGVYQRIIAICQEHGFQAVYIMLPEVGYPVDSTHDVQLAEKAGFEVVDLTGVYKGFWGKTLWVAEWDAHPNPRGHQIVANRLYEVLKEKNVIPFPSAALQGIRSNDEITPVSGSILNAIGNK